jgi:hypothetical protein
MISKYQHDQQGVLDQHDQQVVLDQYEPGEMK